LDEYHKQIGATLGELLKLSPGHAPSAATKPSARRNQKTASCDEKKTRQLIPQRALTTSCERLQIVCHDPRFESAAPLKPK